MWVPQCASHCASPRHGAAPSSSPHVPGRARRVCAAPGKPPGRAGLCDADTGGCERDWSLSPGADGWRGGVGTGAWGGARAGCESPQLPGTGVGPATRECAARVSVRGRASRARAASGRTNERACGRALAADVRCGDSATRSDAPAVPRCGSLGASARASSAARRTRSARRQAPQRPIEK